jgi:hypothetical protein
MRRRLRLAVPALLSVVLLTACDWRGHEHEKKVAAERRGAQVQQLQQETDAFDARCATDASRCFNELVRASATAALGPAPGAVGVTQVCCLVPATDVVRERSFPSGFQLGVGAGVLRVGITRGRGPAQPSSTLRGLPAQVTVRAPGRVIVRWQESGLTYIAVGVGIDEAAARRALESLVLHRP